MRSFSAIAPQALLKPVTRLASKTFNTKFDNQPALPPTTASAVIRWFDYGAGTAKPNVAISVNVQSGTSVQLLDRILSVRIDNLGNPVPVYVFFPDTGDTIACPAFSVVWEPVETGSFNAVIIGEGFTDGALIQTDGSFSQTAVYFCNFDSQPFFNPEFTQAASLWKASASITRGNTILNQNYDVPAVGDQFIYFALDIQTAGLTRFLFGQGQAKFIIITGIQIYGEQMSRTTSDGNGFFAAQTLESTGISGVLGQFNIYMFPNTQLTHTSAYLSGHMNLKLDGSQSWQARNISTSPGVGSVTGVFQWYITYTTSPT